MTENNDSSNTEKDSSLDRVVLVYSRKNENGKNAFLLVTDKTQNELKYHYPDFFHQTNITNKSNLEETIRMQCKNFFGYAPTDLKEIAHFAKNTDDPDLKEYKLDINSRLYCVSLDDVPTTDSGYSQEYMQLQDIISNTKTSDITKLLTPIIMQYFAFGEHTLSPPEIYIGIQIRLGRHNEDKGNLEKEYWLKQQSKLDSSMNLLLSDLDNKNSVLLKSEVLSPSIIRGKLSLNSDSTLKKEELEKIKNYISSYSDNLKKDTAIWKDNALGSFWCAVTDLFDKITYYEQKCLSDPHQYSEVLINLKKEMEKLAIPWPPT